MASANIIFQQNGDGYTTPVSRDDLVLNSAVTVLNQNNSGITAWQWVIVDKPTNSTAALVSPTSSSTTFTPDIEGTYLIKLVVNAGSVRDQKGAAVKTANLHYRIPAATETTEFDGYRGWAKALNTALTLIDDGYSAVPDLSLQSIYDASNPAHIKVNSTNNGVRIEDAASPLSGNIFEVVSDNDSTKYFQVASDGTTVDALNVDNLMNIRGFDVNPTGTTTGQGLIYDGASYVPVTIDGENIPVGTPSTGNFNSGLINFSITTALADTIEQIDEVLAALAPAPPSSMAGTVLTNSISLFTGKLSNISGATYKSGQGVGTTATYITNQATFSLTTLASAFNNADSGVLNVIVNGSNVGSFDLSTAFDPTFKTSQQGATYNGNTGLPYTIGGGKLTIQTVGEYNSFPLWQRGAVRVNMSSPISGYNTIQLNHVVNAVTRNAVLVEIFYDARITTPSVSTPTLSVSSSTTKTLSGLVFLTIGSVLTSGATVTNGFANTYLQTPLSYSFSAGIASGSIAITDGYLSGFSPSAPNSTDTITITAKPFTLAAANQKSLSERITLTYTDVFGGTFVGTSASQNILVNTYGNISTDLSESFVDENYRLANPGTYPSDYTSIPGSITGIWTSSSLLSNGNAQVVNGTLIYPITNYSSGYLPAQAADYSGFTGTQVYYRAIKKSSVAHSSGTLNIPGLTAADIGISGTVTVEIKFPSVTGWKDIGQSFNPSLFTNPTDLLLNGQGCQTSASGSQFGFSMGTGSTIDSGFMLIVRISFLSSGKIITGLSEITW